MFCDVSSLLAFVILASSPSTVRLHKFVPLLVTDSSSFVSVVGRWEMALVSVDVVLVLAILSRPGLETGCRPESSPSSRMDICNFFNLLTFLSHAQSSQSDGMLSNFRQRTELRCGKQCKTVGFSMVTVFSRGSELKASVNLVDNVAVRLGL